MALSHISKIYAVQDMQISQILGDYATGTAPTAPSTPSAPTVTGSGGSSSWSYKVVLSNGTDSAQSTAGTVATGPATLAGLAASPNTVTLAVTVPAGQVAKILRSTVPDASTLGMIGEVGPGGTAFSDTGMTAVAYVANPEGAGVLLAPKVDIPGIQSIEISGTVKNSTLRGDFALLDSISVLQDLRVKFSFAKANLDAMAVMVGGTVTDSGSTPNRIARWKLYATTPTDTTNRFHYFQMECQSVGADPVNGDVHFVLPKCILADFPTLGMADEDYEKFQASAMAIPRTFDGLWLDVPVNETTTVVGQNR